MKGAWIPLLSRGRRRAIIAAAVLAVGASAAGVGVTLYRRDARSHTMTVARYELDHFAAVAPEIRMRDGSGCQAPIFAPGKYYIDMDEWPDPWGTPMRIWCLTIDRGSFGFALSLGEDGELGTDDDLVKSFADLGIPPFELPR